MIKGMIERESSYDIPYTAEIREDHKKIVIVVHGFGSSKESPTAQMLMENLPEHGIGVIAFDFPAHGDSPVDGWKLRIDHCIDDLKAVENLARKNNPEAQVEYFGSSFGAYIILNYIKRDKVKGAKAFLRSAAVNMPELFREPAPDEKLSLRTRGYLVQDYGSGRPLKVTWAFLNDLQEHQLMENFDAGDSQLKMIHGSSDETISYDRAKEFAEKNGIPLVTVEGGDHRLSVSGAPEKVLQEALDFFYVT